MTAVPWELFEKEGALKGKPADSCGVAMGFLPQDQLPRAPGKSAKEGDLEPSETPGMPSKTNPRILEPHLKRP